MSTVRPTDGKCPVHPAVFCRLNPSSMAFHCYKCDLNRSVPLRLAARDRTRKYTSSESGTIFSERSAELSKALVDVQERREKILLMFDTITAKRSHLKGSSGEWFSADNDKSFEGESDTEEDSETRTVVSMESLVQDFSLYKEFLKIVTMQSRKKYHPRQAEAILNSLEAENIIFVVPPDAEKKS